MKNQPYAEIVYKHKKSGEIFKVRWMCVDKDHALKIAKKIRPRYTKLISVTMVYEYNV